MKSDLRRTCPTESNPEGKRRYATLDSANAELDKIWRFATKGRTRATILPCRSYRCAECHGYHHTSKPLREGQEMPRVDR